MGIIIARNYGAKNEDQLRKSVAATVIIGGILSLFMIFIGAVGLYPLLQFLGTPSAIVSQSYLYIATIVNGVAVTFAYNLCAGLLRAVGDSLARTLLPDYRRYSQYSSIFILLPNRIGSPIRWNRDHYCAKFFPPFFCFFYIRKKVPFLLPSRTRFCVGSKAPIRT
ncbi:MAG: MATE family efflux transporter [Streptococcus parasanguinis]